MPTFPGLKKKLGIVKAAFPRENDLATASPYDRLDLVYAEYSNNISNDNLKITNEPPLTLVFLHSTGLQKEAWEPIIAEIILNKELNKNNIIGRVFAIDNISSGDSRILNEKKLGPESSWVDGGRDVISFLKEISKDSSTPKVSNSKFIPHLLNNNNNNLPSPVILIGHSIGGAHALIASVLEPGMISGVIVLDPVILSLSNVISKLNLPQKEYKHIIISKTMKQFGLFNKLRLMVKDEFKSKSEWLHYMNNKSLMASYHPAVKNVLVDSAVCNPDLTNERHYISNNCTDITKKLTFISNVNANNNNNNSNNDKLVLKTPSWSHMQSYIGAIKSLGWLEPNIPNIKCPVLHVVAGNGTWNPPETENVLKNNMKKGLCTKVIIPNVKHMFIVEDPYKASGEIITYIKNTLYPYLSQVPKRKIIQYDELKNLRKDINKTIVGLKDGDLATLRGFDVYSRL